MPLRCICLHIVMLIAMVTHCAEVLYPPQDWVSGTLPVMYITTHDSVPVISRDEYVDATYWIDPMGNDAAAVGGPLLQYPLQIKGRGNSTWNLEKKSYRIKLAEKTPLMGMDKNRHFVLLAEWCEGRGRLTWEIGFYVSRLMGLAWTPEHHPVELVLNGEYMGLYFLSEKIRVGKQRVNITQQADNETDPELITGGWLCENDNNSDSVQTLLIDRTSGRYLRTTIHDPEVLSPEQLNYIHNLVKDVDAAIYCKDKTSTEWEQYIDIDMLARFYLTNEVLYEIESFAGSCYWSKDRGEDTKIIFGPVWDFDQAGRPWGSQKFCYEQQDGDTFNGLRNHWIAEIAKYPRFQQRVRQLWTEFNDSAAASIEPHAREWVERLRAVHKKDVFRWYDQYQAPQDSNINIDIFDIDQGRDDFLNVVKEHSMWLDEQWSKPLPLIGDVNADGNIDSLDTGTLARHLIAMTVDSFNIVNANAYDDNVIDISDLVGTVRQVYLREHPDTILPYPTPLAYGQSDKSIDTRAKLQIKRITTNDDESVNATIVIAGDIDYTAMQLDLSIDNGRILSVTPHNCESHRMMMNYLDDSHSSARLLLWSDSLTSVPHHGGHMTINARIALNDHGVHSFTLNHAILAESDMYPHCLAKASQAIALNDKNGDINNDGVIDVDDVNAIIYLIIYDQTDKDKHHSYADLTGEGNIDIDDVNQLIKIILAQ